ncbi:MAG TPA: hypothetical protein PLO37_14840 [Candidatus Hydrogenedentes bacterium]|nr:hypothetical protein [Candidatus Hydrogenedentota bacterium]
MLLSVVKAWTEESMMFGVRPEGLDAAHRRSPGTVKRASRRVLLLVAQSMLALGAWLKAACGEPDSGFGSQGRPHVIPRA